MHKLVLLRHGESTWNRENRFTGWTDVDLSEKGVQEAKNAGRVLKKEGFVFDLAYTSVLKRAIKTLYTVQEEMDLLWIPVIKNWRLNERHYGALQGLNKSETAVKHGEEQVRIWRRAFDIAPPKLEPDDPRSPAYDPMYADLKPNEKPLTECLKDTVARVMLYWRKEIVPNIKKGKNIIIVAHGNSLRAMVKNLSNIPDADIVNLNIPTAMPLVYELDKNLKPVKDYYYLGDPEEVKKAMEAVANQGKAKK